MGPPPAIKEDGTFQIENVMPGKYRLMVSGPASGYVSSARYGELDVLGGEFEIGDSPAPIRVAVAAGGGSVSGTVTDESKPAAGMAFLIPADPARRMQWMIRSAALDQNGMFTLNNVAPGEYLAMAFQEQEYGIWEGEEEFRKLESKAKKISVGKTGTESIALSLIK
jgi:hypothetical protein